MERKLRKEHNIYMRMQHGTISEKASVVKVRPNEQSLLKETESVEKAKKF